MWSNGSDIFNADRRSARLTDPRLPRHCSTGRISGLVDKSTILTTELGAMQGSINAFRPGRSQCILGNAWDMGTLKTAAKTSTGRPCSRPRQRWEPVLVPRTSSAGEYAPDQAATRHGTYIRDFTLQYAVDVMTAFPPIPSLKQLLYAFSNEITISLGWDTLISLATQPDVLRIPGAGAKWDKISQLIQAELDLAFIGEKTCAQAADACPKVELART